MSGAFHIRMVAGILITLCGLVIVLQVTAFLMSGELEHPSNLVGAILNIALVVWLCRGSNTAAYILSAFMIIGIAGWVLVLFAGGLESDPFAAGFFAFGLLASAYCWWAVTFSKEVRAELARRREANEIQDREERQKFYQQVGETAPD
jgi:hypothetical protein